QNVALIDLDSVGSIVFQISPASIEWTAPNSNHDCIEGYEVCWNSTTFDETYSNCSNLSNDTTSYTLAEDIQVCVEYSASVVVLGTDGQRSPTIEFSFTYTSPNDVDLLVNTNITVNSSSISLEYETSYDYPFCGLNVTGCFSSDDTLSECISMSGQGGGLDMAADYYSLSACTTYYSTLTVTVVSVSQSQTITNVRPITTNSTNSTMIQSVNVDNVTDSNATIS
ncbi:unnamed protein product, partial [Timema podura]|nr:unnamed protein product [Timema podura]